MIVVQGTGSSMFETAYFVLKKDAEKRRYGERDMIGEANRIINENIGEPPQKKSFFGKAPFAVPFFFGAFFGVALLFIINLFF